MEWVQLVLPQEGMLPALLPAELWRGRLHPFAGNDAGKFL